MLHLDHTTPMFGLIAELADKVRCATPAQFTGIGAFMCCAWSPESALAYVILHQLRGGTCGLTTVGFADGFSAHRGKCFGPWICIPSATPDTATRAPTTPPPSASMVCRTALSRSTTVRLSLFPSPSLCRRHLAQTQIW